VILPMANRKGLSLPIELVGVRSVEEAFAALF